MSWLRLDDNFAQHPKFEGWATTHRWAFVELMLYCAKYRTGGRVPADLTLLPRPVNTRLLGLAEASGWLDRDTQGDLVIHDWAIYNPSDPTAAERQQRYRDRNAERNETRNENRDGNGASRVGARARPVPSPTPKAEKPLLSADGSGDSLPVDKELFKSKILTAIGGDADERTPSQVSVLVDRLPQASVEKVLESLRTQKPRNRAAYAVGALQSEFAELAGRT